ncbi:MAG: FecR domain-containing protein [Bacteriovorax sp.]|nr:FecR domain-containing protein [Bacteriovorax sp.]
MRISISSGLLCFTLFLLNTALAARAPIASVVKMRGTITKLLPGAIEATPVLMDDKFPEDTSLVTGPKSFIKIKFIDNSELNMGPDSKIVISEMSTDSVGVISLLKGRIRTEVQKSTVPSEKEKNKFYIRTRTAAMGVRGTDFQTIYNPDNRMTSLLTYKGSVAMAKIDEKTHQRLEKSNTEIIRDSDNTVREIKVIPGKQMGEQEELVEVLNNKNTVIVPPGQNSFTSDALKKSSLPVKISPVQLNALYKNTEFNEKNVLNLKSGVDAQNPNLDLLVAVQQAPVEGLYNAKTGDFAPKAGGFIDQKTGLYIAPEASASLDDKTGVYVAEKSGNFDADTGDYFAPKGLVLDAKKGFVLEQNADVKPELLALKEDMNRLIARDRVVGDLDGEVQIAAKTLSEKFIRDRLSFSLMVGSQDLKIKNNSHDVKDSGAFRFNVLWQVASTNRFSPILGLTYSKVGYSALASHGDIQDSRSLFTISTGLKYALTNRVDLFSFLSLDQAHYAGQTGVFPDVYQYKRIVMTKLNLGVDAELVKSNRFTLMGNLVGTKGFRKKYNNLTVTDVSGFTLKITPQYAINEKKSVGLGFFASKESSKINNAFGTVDQKRDDHGVEVKYTVDQ